jgi:hypothetical protein
MKTDTDISYMALNKARDKRKVKRGKRQKAMLAGGTNIPILKAVKMAMKIADPEYVTERDHSLYCYLAGFNKRGKSPSSK